MAKFKPNVFLVTSIYCSSPSQESFRLEQTLSRNLRSTTVETMKKKCLIATYSVRVVCLCFYRARIFVHLAFLFDWPTLNSCTTFVTLVYSWQLPRFSCLLILFASKVSSYWKNFYSGSWWSRNYIYSFTRLSYQYWCHQILLHYKM